MSSSYIPLATDHPPSGSGNGGAAGTAGAGEGTGVLTAEKGQARTTLQGRIFSFLVKTEPPRVRISLWYGVYDTFFYPQTKTYLHCMSSRHSTHHLTAV